MRIGEYLIEYAKEKIEGINCCNTKCHFFNDSGKYIQNCSAGTRDNDSIVPYCMDYIPCGQKFVPSPLTPIYDSGLEYKFMINNFKKYLTFFKKMLLSSHDCNKNI